MRSPRLDFMAKMIAVLVAAVSITTAQPKPALGADDPNATANPNSKKEAQAFFSQGLKLAESGDLKGAVAAFRSAYDKSPTFRVLYNIAQLCERMNDAVCAVRTYDQYLRDGGKDIPAKRRAEVEADRERLSRTLATIAITTNYPGADVTIDDEAVGKSPLPAPIVVAAGEHNVVARLQGKSIDRSVKVVAGDAVSVDLQIPKDEPKPKPVAEPEPAEKTPPPSPKRPFPIVPWAATGAFAVGTVISGVLASSAYSTFKEKRDAFPVTREELDDAQGAARDLFLLTALLGGVTVVSAGVASYFTFIAPAPPASTAPRVGMGMRMGIGPRGIVVSGTLP